MGVLALPSAMTNTGPAGLALLVYFTSKNHHIFILYIIHQIFISDSLIFSPTKQLQLPCAYLLSFSSKCNVRRDPTGAVLGHGGGEVPRVRRKCEIVWRMWKCLNVASLQCRDPYMVIAEKAGSTFSPFWGNIFRLVVINNGTA